MHYFDLSQFLNKWFLKTQFCTSVKTTPLLGKNINNIFYLLLRITQTHSNYIQIWATQPFVIFKTQWKNETYENFIYYFKKYFTWNAIQTQCNFLVKKCIVLLIWVYKFLSILQNSKVANNSITILGYANDK